MPKRAAAVSRKNCRIRKEDPAADAAPRQWGLNRRRKSGIIKEKRRTGNETCHEKYLHWDFGPCRRRENNAVRGAFVSGRGYPPFGPGGSSGRIFRYGHHGASAGHHHFFQAGGAGAELRPRDAAGHAGPCGLFRRDGTDASGIGLRCAGDLRHRRCAGPHPDAVGAFGALSCSHVSFYQQNGPCRNGPGRAAGPPKGKAGRRVRGFRRFGNAGGGGRCLR